MQLILIPNRRGTGKSVFLSAGQLTFGAVSAVLLVLVAAMALAFIALRPIARSRPGAAEVQDQLMSPSASRPHYFTRRMSAKLHAMATKMGDLQARTTELDLRGASIAALAGLKPRGFRFATPPAPGGPTAAAASGTLSTRDLERALSRLAAQISIRADNLDVIESRVLDDVGRKQLLPTMFPVQHARIGSGFGMRTDPFTGLPAMHEGVDFDAPVGTPIRAAGSGIVVFAGHHPDFGNLIVIDDGNGIITRYAHCSRLDVNRGEVVSRGQIIAAIGDTGRSTGPHLHFEIRRNGVAQNPMKFLRAGQRQPQKVARSHDSHPG